MHAYKVENVRIYEGCLSKILERSTPPCDFFLLLDYVLPQVHTKTIFMFSNSVGIHLYNINGGYSVGEGKFLKDKLEEFSSQGRPVTIEDACMLLGVWSSFFSKFTESERLEKYLLYMLESEADYDKI